MTFREQNPPWRPVVWLAILLILTVVVLCVHGYHPLAEDGGLYLAGVEYSLDRTLFPHYTEFVQEHLRFSLFAPAIVLLVRGLHVSLMSVVFALNLTSIGLTLAGGRAIARRVYARDEVQLAAVLLLAAWWTLPVAGTSLMLMDPYVTARSFSMPLSLFAIAFAMDGLRKRRSALGCALCLVLAATMHPLMAGVAAGVIAVLATQGERLARYKRWRSAGALLIAALLIGGLMQWSAPAESATVKAAAITRYYWFLSQWQWYELLGVIAPLVIFWALLRFANLSEAGRSLCRACIVAGTIAIVTATCFARENLATHLVARMQPLRVYVLLYAIMALLLGGVAAQVAFASKVRAARVVPYAVIAALALVMGWVQRQTFPASMHLEMPWRAEQNPNPWVQAFLWVRDNTPHDAIFAMDAKYVNMHGEDAQTFRSIALRSAVPDYSKDGGEAAITPALADAWWRGASVQKDLSGKSDAERDSGLREAGATWVILLKAAQTTHDCPYFNQTVKVCRLVSATGSSRS